MSDRYSVYILASRYRDTLYVGVTNDLSRRVGEYKAGAVAGFTKKYRVDRLVHSEEFASILEARSRERTRRDWKIHLIETNNPRWRDLSDQIAS